MLELRVNFRIILYIILIITSQKKRGRKLNIKGKKKLKRKTIDIS